MAPEQVILALAKVARPVLLRYFEPRSCIASTRIGIDVLAYFGIKAVPVPLLVAIFNAEAARMVNEGMSLSDVAEAMWKISKDQPGGPWTIALGAEVENGDGWAGHLMIGIPQYRTLLDLSIDQANRPLKNIEFNDDLRTMHVPDESWWKGAEDRAILATDSGLTLILDHEAPDPDGYKRSKNWVRQSSVYEGRRVFKEATGEIIRLVKAQLAAEEAE